MAHRIRRGSHVFRGVCCRMEKNSFCPARFRVGEVHHLCYTNGRRSLLCPPRKWGVPQRFAFYRPPAFISFIWRNFIHNRRSEERDSERSDEVLRLFFMKRFIVFFLFLIFVPVFSARAFTFNPDNIITDFELKDKDSMSLSAIQSF